MGKSRKIKETGQRRWMDQSNVLCKHIHNLFPLLLEPDAVYHRGGCVLLVRKEAFFVVLWLPSIFPTSRILDEKIKSLVSISELWSKWTMLLMKNIWWILTCKPKRRNWTLGNQKKKKKNTPLTQLPVLWTLPGTPYATLKEARNLPAAWFLAGTAGSLQACHKAASCVLM